MLEIKQRFLGNWVSGSSPLDCSFYKLLKMGNVVEDIADLNGRNGATSNCLGNTVGIFNLEKFCGKAPTRLRREYAAEEIDALGYCVSCVLGSRCFSDDLKEIIHHAKLQSLRISFELKRSILSSVFGQRAVFDYVTRPFISPGQRYLSSCWLAWNHNDIAFWQSKVAGGAQTESEMVLRHISGS